MSDDSQILKKPMYVSLHTHSDYSLLDGLGKVEQYLEKAVEFGMPALALTDHGVLYGAIDFYKKAKKAGIKPIIGCELYIAARTRQDKVSKIDSKYTHLTVLARTTQGYKNLIEIVTAGWMEGFYYKPRVDRELLAEKGEGLIILTGCANSEVAHAITNDKLDEAEKLIQFYQGVVGEDNVYLEIQDHPHLPQQAVINAGLVKLHSTHGWPLIATTDCHYVKLSDKAAHEVLLAVQSKSADEDKRWSLENVDLHLRSPEEMATAFADYPNALENSLVIAEKCDIEIEFGANHLPVFDSGSGLTNEAELRRNCEEGMIKRYGKDPDPGLKERLEYELEVINRMGFASYFLIVADFVNWAKQQGIIVGPGRGSAAGSIVAYLTRITELDPIKYNLLFERFLNPDRISMPDIDIDFADTDRGRVIEYVRNRYGDDHVAGIITFGTMAARAAIRDTGRAIGMTYQEVDRIAKLIPPPKQGKHVPLIKLLEETPDLKRAYDAEPATKKLFDLAAQLEGTFRHSGQHASAFIISKEPLIETAPLQPAPKGDVAHVTQFSMYPIEDLGLLKMDFLGLSNLSIIQRALEIIEAVYGDKIDISTIPLDDPKTFDLLARAETTGVFQLESSGMKRYLRELKPERFDHIVAMVALYRPGPLQFADSYIARKNGQEAVVYDHPLMEKALKNSYGIMLYQEDVMQLSKDMSGFTGGQADTLRKAIGKKIPKLMAEVKTLFIDGAVKNGVAKDLAEKIFTQIEEFAAYSFNRAHSACYALIAYQTAYLKAHYPAGFMAALMTADHDDTDRLAIEIEEARRMKMEVLSPDVNESFVDFGTVKESGNIRFGLAGIKNIGAGVAEAIVRERKKAGPYRSLLQFVERLGPDTINKKVLENLAKGGALDRFAERNQVLAAVDQILKLSNAQRKATETNQIGLFDVGGPVAIAEPTLELPPVEPADQRQRLAWEKELLGMFLSAHPLKEVEELMRAHATPLASITEGQVGQMIRVAGIMVTLRKITTKDNASMAFGMLEDLSTSREIVFFPRTLEQYNELVAQDSMLLIEGRVSLRDGEIKIAAEKLWPLGTQLELEEIPALEQRPSGRRGGNRAYFDSKNGTGGANSGSGTSTSKPGKPANYALTITLPASADQNVLKRMKGIIEKYPGQTRVILRMRQDDAIKEIQTKSAVDLTTPVESELAMLVGKVNIGMQEL